MVLSSINFKMLLVVPVKAVKTTIWVTSDFIEKNCGSLFDGKKLVVVFLSALVMGYGFGKRNQ